MTIFKNFAIKFFLLILLLIGFNFIYKYTFFQKDIQTHSPIINLVNDVVAKKSEIVYIGESSNNTCRKDDLDKRAISDFIADYYPARNFGDITKGASHAGIYYELLRNIPEDSNIKTIIVTLNLRSFDANWIYSGLETPLQKSIVLLKDRPPLLSRFLLAFKGYDIKTEAEREKQFKRKWKREILQFPEPFEFKNVIEWDKGMYHKGILNADGSKNEPLTALACHYVKTYAFQIDTLANPRIKDFDRIVVLAKKRNWNLVFNLMAENTEKANSMVGKELIYLIKQNRDLLVKRYNRNNVIVVDNLEVVENSDYIDQTWTTEHYAEFGRKTIAKNVAECLKKFYPDDFKNVTYTLSKPIAFFNDCEGNGLWGQMTTLTDEESFSGKKSSKTGQKKDYGITFEYPVKNLPDSLKQISVDFQLFQTSLNNDATYVIQISGEKIENQWNGFLLKDLSGTTQKWVRVSFKFPLPSNFYEADLIKIYAYNPTNSIAYIDDIGIVFNK
jgi:hypothetical protein